MSRYRLKTLAPNPGLVRKEDGTEVVRFSKQLAILIYLAARPGGRASRDELIGLLWEGSSLRDARNALRQAVFQLRHATSRDLVHGDDVLSVSEADVEFDVCVLRRLLAEGRLEAALEVYQTDFVSTAALPGGREFEHWADGIRQQLAAERRQVLRTLVEQCADQARWREGARFAELLADADQLDLRPRLRLVELLALAGNPVQAAAAAERARQVAAERVGAATPAELEEAIARALAPAASSERRVHDGFPRHPELVGRAEEFGTITELWKAARGGAGGAVLVTGEAGIGKTRLITELRCRLIRDRGSVLAAACSALEPSDPLQPYLELVREAAGAPGLAGAMPACLEILAALVPEVAQRFRQAVAPRPLPIAPQAAQSAILDALAAIADDAPLAVVIEDLHWAAPATIELALRLAQRAPRTRMLVVLTSRDFAERPASTLAVRGLAQSPDVREVPLGPLDAVDIEYLLGSMATLPEDGAGPRLAEWLVRRTGGIPLYVLELLQELFDAGEMEVQSGRWHIRDGGRGVKCALEELRSSQVILGSRLSGLGEPACRVMVALAVWSREADAAILERLTDLSPAVFEEAVAVLEQRRIIGRAGGAARMLHEEMGAAVVRFASPRQVAQLHARAAEIAADAAQHGLEQEWAVALQHAAIAGGVDDAIRYAAQSGQGVERRSGTEAAREAIGRLIASVPQAVGGHIAAALQPVLEGRWTVKRWQDERSGRARRVRAARIAGLTSLALLGMWTASTRQPSVVPPLGGGYLAIAPISLRARADSVIALRIDSALAVHMLSRESLPPGVRHGFDAKLVSPDARLALFPCSRPGEKATVVCGLDLATEDTVALARYDEDAGIVGWPSFGSAYVVHGGYRAGADYAYALALADSGGRIRYTIARDRYSYGYAVVSPADDRLLAWRRPIGRGGWSAVLMTLAGRVEGAVPWCDSTIGAWSADGQYLACGVPSRDTLRVGLAQPGSVPVHVPLPGALSGGPMWSPDGRFIAATIDAGGQRSLYLLDHEGEGRLLRVDRLEPMASLLGWVRQTRVHHAQRVAFDRDTLVIPVGQAARIPQPARTASGDTLRQPVAVRWAVEDTLIAHVGGSGLVTGDRPGVTRLIASLGPLLADTAVVIVEPRESQLVLHDQFEVGLDSNAWKPFGNPPPRTLRQRGRNGSTAFHNNGDGAWASGIVSRHTFSVRRGLTLEYLARTPWATGEWHALHVQLSVTPADSFRLSVEDPNPGARFLLSAFGPQVGEQGSPVRLASLSAGRWQGRRGLAPDGAYVIMPKRLLDGAWHRYRLVLYPTGEARWFADGAPLAPRIETGMEGVSRVALVIGGKSVNTLVLVDDVRLWEGVMLEPPLRRR